MNAASEAFTSGQPIPRQYAGESTPGGIATLRVAREWESSSGMYAFHATVWLRGLRLQQGPLVPLRGDLFATLIPTASYDDDPTASSDDDDSGVTFEQAADEMAKLERMIVEPDGSFVYSGDHPVPWQLEGNLYDRAGRLLHIQLWGHCPAAAFDRLLNCFDWPGTERVFECVREGVYLSEVEFRRFAGLSTRD